MLSSTCIRRIFVLCCAAIAAGKLAASDGDLDLSDMAQEVEAVSNPEVPEQDALDLLANSLNEESISSRTKSSQGIRGNGAERRELARQERVERRRARRDSRIGPEVRSYDGADNNLQATEWGSTFSHLQRLADANYADGISSMVFDDRPGPREIRNAIVDQLSGEQVINVYGTSDFLWQWGQFIDHDLGLTDGSADEPQDIVVPIGDQHFDPANTGSAVIPFNRALHDPDTGTDVDNVREQENEITSWIDGSMVYGSTDARAAALRVGPDSPFLKTSQGNLLPFNIEGLVNANGPVRQPASLFVAGDVRANEQVGLTVMHTLFVREHNRVASVLQAINPKATAERIFQAARRVVVAEIQKITYDEFLPALLGSRAISPYRGYDSSINPTIYNEFSAAAFRLGHSMVSEQLLRLDASGQELTDGHLNLAEVFFGAPKTIRTENDIDPILRGLAAQAHQGIDVQVVHPLRNLLFGAPGSGGLDLTSLNIQRGRDHGLPTYNDMRLALNLPAAKDFSDITDDVVLQRKLRSIYGTVSSVDLWVGGLSETPLRKQGSQLGELFHTIVARQFTELRDGDRFWYQTYLGAKGLKYVENRTLAKIIRQNTAIGDEIQDKVFFVK